MIIQNIIVLIVNLFERIFQNVSIDQMPSDTFNNAKSTIQSMITSAESLIDLAMPYTVAKVLLLIVIVIEGVVAIYSLVMWVLRKIPVVSIE